LGQVEIILQPVSVTKSSDGFAEPAGMVRFEGVPVDTGPKWPGIPRASRSGFPEGIAKIL
jgi:hypothetical protein